MNSPCGRDDNPVCGEKGERQPRRGHRHRSDREQHPRAGPAAVIGLSLMHRHMNSRARCSASLASSIPSATASSTAACAWSAPIASTMSDRSM
jgi:hypothetical protein